VQPREGVEASGHEVAAERRGLEVHPQAEVGARPAAEDEGLPGSRGRGHRAQHLRQHLRGQADRQLDVDAFAAKFLGLAPSEVSIFMNGKGFLKKRRDRGKEKNVYFYEYTFPTDAGKERLYVNICENTSGK
jgi:hypothetical protein